MIHDDVLIDPARWRGRLARDVERRRVIEPGALDRAEQAVREFPAMAFAAGLLPVPLPVQHVEKQTWAGRAPNGGKVRHRVASEPGPVRGWLLGRGVVITMGQVTVRPVHTAIDTVALSESGVLVESVITGWEPYPPPVEVELDLVGDSVATIALDRFLDRVLTERGPHPSFRH
ncbi:hypothetical protein [Actinokineospora iranica]|uniref:Uncharacterized protein n=1 Tax=Actinokineospora iranica TaxID=1271860 RepID=A0A1G6WKX3_9PSEU|nr:hypothetical protein [Actinokineospora iranica]SDD66451.1 hypothetical protein SAMN05216174_11560 [Actinokineospora iranica]